MTLVPFKSSLLELESLDAGPDFLTCDTLAAMAESQRELFHSQIDQLERLVVSQCQLTGMNPLAQEMAAGALSIKIGKKPRDLLNPKAVQYMQSVFSMKDNIGKRETREISALCGVTVRQVNEFFTSQRTRVKKFIRLSREKATRLELPKPPTISTDPESSTASTSKSVQNEEAASANLEALVGASRSVQEEGGMNEEDKKIVDDVVGLMSKETSFSGQVRLMQSVMRINNDTVLSWFIAKEGLTILLTWLGEATTEEQTSVILTIFKVLCHLPLNKAEPTQISAILQAINRLRFYRTSDISNRAKILLSKWTKLLRTQLLKRNPNDSQKDLIRKQRIRELLGAQSGNSEIAFPEDILALTENGDEKVAENKKTLRLLNAPYEDLTKKNGATSSSSLKNKVRRKVLLVENAPNRNPLNTTRVARTAHTTNSRPLSADDIQKAKLRASYMQQKLGIKPDLLKAEDKPKPLQPKKLVPVSRSIQQPDIDPLNLSDRLNRAKIRWRPPPGVKIDASWQVCTGENSKESAVQAKRTRRGSEMFYPDPLTIPANPKDPWDKELDFDDSLTPEIPIDQPSDPDPIQQVEEPGSSSQTGFTELAGSAESGSGPDMELLAVLLKNPELVFALTSGQTTGLSDEQMVSLLDTLKNSGVTLSDLANGLANSSSQGSGSANESLPGSLPSPTPPSPLERVNWKSPPVTSPVISPPVVSATNPYNNVGSYNAQHNQSNMLSLSMNLPAQQHFEPQNPYLGQNVSNHQMMPPTRSWDQNMGYSHVQNGYNNNNNNQNGYQVMQNGYNNNNNQNQSGSGTDTWAQGGGMGESSAVWGYNGQRRNYNGKGWYDSHERDRRGGGGG